MVAEALEVLGPDCHELVAEAGMTCLGLGLRVQAPPDNKTSRAVLIEQYIFSFLLRLYVHPFFIFLLYMPGSPCARCFADIVRVPRVKHAMSPPSYTEAVDIV